METQEILKLAELAAIEIKDNEVEGIRDALTEIMSLIDQLRSSPAKSAEPLAHPLDITLTPRPDIADDNNQRENIQKVAPATRNGFYIVPPVID